MNESGNVLFLILICVVLFAALSYVVQDSSRVTNSTTGLEKSKLAVGEIESYIVQNRLAISRMLSHGVELRRLDVRSSLRRAVSGATRLEANAACTTTDCQLYHPSGGAAFYRHFEDYANPNPPGFSPGSFKPGHTMFFIYDMAGIGSSLPDIVFRISAVTLDVCRAFNAKRSISGELAVPDDTAGRTQFAFSGASVATNLDSSVAWRFGYTEPAIFGQMEFCDEVIDLVTNNNYGNIYAVALAR
jgi:hypothetical protein